MEGEGPFLWLSRWAPPRGHRGVPPGGMCLSAFLLVQRGGRLLLGRYADHPAWEELAGLDAQRVRAHGEGWTLPARHLRFGEEPREAARHIAEAILGLRGLRIGEPRVATDLYTPARFPQAGPHYDVWLLFEADGAPEHIAAPPWYRDLAWHDPRALPPGAWARGHGDVARRWLALEGAGDGERGS